MNKSVVIFLLVIASLSSALELDVNANSQHSDEIYIENVPAEPTDDTVQIQPIENIEDSDTDQETLLNIDTHQGHENESGRKARQFFGGGGGGYYGGRGYYGGGFYPRPYYGGGGGFYGRRYGYGFGGYRGGFRYYG